MIENNEYLSSLVSAGSDALSNLFYVKLVSSNSLKDNVITSLIIREQDFTPPTFTQGKTSIAFVTTKLDVPTAQYTGTKEFPLKFRLDANYDAYKKLLWLRSATANHSIGYVSGEIPTKSNGSDQYFNVEVYAITNPIDLNSYSSMSSPQGSNDFKLLYQFQNCWIKEITGFNYSYSGSSPMVITATVGFQIFTDPSDNL